MAVRTGTGNFHKNVRTTQNWSGPPSPQKFTSFKSSHPIMLELTMSFCYWCFEEVAGSMALGKDYACG